MEKLVFWVFFIFTASLWAPSVGGAGPFLGCKDFCARQYPPETNFKGYDNCLVQTQTEGYCGSRPSAPSRAPPSRDTQTNNNPQPAQNTNQNQNQNQNAQCQLQFQELYQRCNDSIEETSSSCDEKNDEGMNSVSATASQLALALGQQTSSSIQAACSRMADISQAANGALAAYRLTCSNSIKDCRSRCAELVNYAKANSTCFSSSETFVELPSISESVRQLTRQLRNQNGFATTSSAEALASRCNNYDAKMNEAQQAIQNYGLTSANATQCGQATNGTSQQPVPEFCKANPTYAGCNPAAPVNCSDPQLATTNKVCICSANPRDPVCSSQQKASGNGPNTSLIDSSSRVADNNGAEGFGGDIPDTPGFAHGKINPGGGEGVDGSQGGGTVGGMTGGGSNKGSATTAAREHAAPSNAPSGYNGFYGGSGSFHSGAGGGDSDEGGRVRGASRALPASQEKGGPDLRQFLPGGKYDPRARGIAGASGPDGITGPHSNIWQKIQNRYQVIGPTLIP